MPLLYHIPMLISFVNSVLNRIPKPLYLSQQPCCQHGQTKWADEESNYEDDDADCGGVQNKTQFAGEY